MTTGFSVLRDKAAGVCFIMGDLNWVAPSTLEFLSLLFDQVPTARLFMLLTLRPENGAHPPFGLWCGVHKFNLYPL